MDLLKYRPGLPCPTLYALQAGHPWNGRMAISRVTRPQGKRPAAIFYPLVTSRRGPMCRIHRFAGIASSCRLHRFHSLRDTSSEHNSLERESHRNTASDLMYTIYVLVNSEIIGTMLKISITN
jgi:hypothetical protein